MSATLPTILTLHVLTLSPDAAAAEDDSGDFPLPPLAQARWLGGIEVDWAEDGRTQPQLSHRLWLGLWRDEAAACDAVRRAADWLPGVGTAARHASAALRPYITRGLVNWHGAPAAVCEATGSRPAAAQPIVTLTTFGIARSRDSFAAFGQRMHAARAALRAADGMRAEWELNAVTPAFADPCTLTLWRSEADAMTWAYRKAPHRPSMDWAQAGAIFERSSFTRLVPLAVAGDWPPLAVGHADHTAGI